MKTSLTKRPTVQPIWIILGAALLLIAAALLAVAFLTPGFPLTERGISAEPSPTASTVSTPEPVDTPAPETSSTAVPPAATVNGYTITQSYFSQTVRLNEVLGQLSGASVMGEEDTLQRLIRSELILQGVEEIEEPTEEEVESFIARLERSWGVSDETVVERLQAVELERAFLEDTIERLLTVQAAVQYLEDQGQNLSEWLGQQEQDADIMVYEGAVTAEEMEPTPTAEGQADSEDPTPATDAQSQVPDVAPEFTLRQAGGGQFTLENQLEKGPVVLVFFERCG